jgi:hypothetical protein
MFGFAEWPAPPNQTHSALELVNKLVTRTFGNQCHVARRRRSISDSEKKTIKEMLAQQLVNWQQNARNADSPTTASATTRH